MVNLLIGNKSTKELDILCHELANDKDYRVENVATGKDTVDMYWRINPDILVLDNNLPDMSMEDVINRLSSNPVERKKCNLILTVPPDYKIKLNTFAKINEVIYKPLIDDKLFDAIKVMALDYNTPDLEVGEIDWLLQSLNFNCMSAGYKFMRDAITYCYYRPDELEFLTTVLKYLAYKYNVPESRVRDSLKSCIRPFNNASEYSCPDDLFKVLYNNGHKLSLKDFLERIVFYLIRVKKKGRLF